MKQSLRVESEQIIKQLKSQFSENDKQKRQSAITQARKGVSGMAVPDVPGDERTQLTPGDLQVGAMVFVTSLNAPGTITAVQGKRVHVDVNGFSATVKPSELAALTREELGNYRRKEQGPATPKTRKRSGSAVLRQQQATTELNVIGQTVDEACQNVGHFIDQALMAGISPVRIVHGKGTGALRKGIHEYLRRLPHIARYEIAGYDEGGAGATLVYLK